MEVALKDRLRFFMERAALSPARFAEAVGVTESAISLWLSGKANPKWERLPDIVAALGVDMPTFFGEIECAEAAG